MIPTLPRIRMRNLRFYESMELVYDETGVLGARLKDIINRRLELMFEVQVTWPVGLFLCWSGRHGWRRGMRGYLADEGLFANRVHRGE
jgi:hypothetical protein